MKTYTPKDYHQALILACKGHLRRDDEDSYVESIKRVICEIIGCDDTNHIQDRIVNYWLYEVYEYLMEIDECELSRRNGIKDFLLGNRLHDIARVASFDKNVTNFLIGEIGLVKVFDYDIFRIELDHDNAYMIR